METRIVFHIDFDYFFAQCEEIRKPELKSKPVCVCVFSDRGGDSGAIATANYNARKFGAKSGIPIIFAKKRLQDHKDAVFLPVDFDYYKSLSEKGMEIMEKNGDVFEYVGKDEAYLDVTKKVNGDWMKAEKLASDIKKEIKDKVNLTCSIGISPNKLVSKIASDFQKPDGLTLVIPEKVDMFLQIDKINFKDSCAICDSHTVIRTAHKGKFKGQAFVGCSNFPKCTYTTFLPKSIEVSSSSPPTNKMSSLPTPTVSIQPISSSNNPKNPTDPDRFTLKDAQTLGDILKIDFSKVALSEYHMGLNVELEHEGTIKTNRQLSEIVLAHLDEHEDYYTRLHVMENAPASPSLPFVIEASDGLTHENCGGQIDLQTPHKDRENEITHWDAQCLKCYQKGTVLND